MPGMASSSRTVPGRRVAMALNAWSLRIRNAGTPRCLASAKRQARRASSIPESEATFDRWSSSTDMGRPGVSRLFARFCFAATATFLLPLRFALRGSAEVAVAERLLSVGKVAEVAHQSSRWALVALSEAEHLVDLCLLLLPVGDVGLAPGSLATVQFLGEVAH